MLYGCERGTVRNGTIETWLTLELDESLGLEGDCLFMGLLMFDEVDVHP
jgi:hypothetical protein